MPRPRIVVLGGGYGAGKSSIGGERLRHAGGNWFNPDDYARDLMAAAGNTQSDANMEAWQEGVRRLDRAIRTGRTHAFETTLGGNSIAARLRDAAASHDLFMWYCGLDSPEHHIARVRARVARGGHDIPERKIRERYLSSRANLIALLPYLTRQHVYDNSKDAVIGQPMPNPRLLLQMENGKITSRTDADTLRSIPDWAKPIMEAALRMQ